jgi:hypothetical protein
MMNIAVAVSAALIVGGAIGLATVALTRAAGGDVPTAGSLVICGMLYTAWVCEL